MYRIRRKLSVDITNAKIEQKIMKSKGVITTPLAHPCNDFWLAHRRVKSDLVIVLGNLIANMYINNCLRLYLVPLIHQQNNNMTFQHDNTTPHFAIETQNFFAQNNINPGTGKGGLKGPPMFFLP